MLLGAAAKFGFEAALLPGSRRDDQQKLLRPTKWRTLTLDRIAAGGAAG
jgi:hypothetical protein